MGIVRRETISSAQLKGAKTMVVDIRGSKMGTGNFENSKGVNMIGDSNLVCVDIVAEDHSSSCAFC